MKKKKPSHPHPSPSLLPPPLPSPLNPSPPPPLQIPPSPLSRSHRSKIRGFVYSPPPKCHIHSPHHSTHPPTFDSCPQPACDDSAQRFCVQCDRFHALSAFDEDKGICRLTLAGQYKKLKRLQPEANCVLSYGTLVYFPGKATRRESDGADSDSFTCEDLERTVTNEEERDTSNNDLRDEASSGNLKDQLDETESIQKRTDNPENDQSKQFDAMKKSDAASRKGKRTSSQSSTPNICQVEGCMVDLSVAKDYFRRRKVCEEHFRANKVLVKNLDQRFCQQCSRFHVLEEFDEGRKSCKKMLLGHNMRRRKAQSRSHAGTGIQLIKAQDYKSAESLIKKETRIYPGH